MRALDVLEQYPLVTTTDNAIDAARLLASRRLPGVVVIDDTGEPVAVLPASEVVRFLIPSYVQDDPSLARVYDEKAADACAEKLHGKLVRDLLLPHHKRAELAVVTGRATVMECAAVMARLRSPLAVVVDDHSVRGVITAAHLLELLLPDAG